MVEEKLNQIKKVLRQNEDLLEKAYEIDKNVYPDCQRLDINKCDKIIDKYIEIYNENLKTKSPKQLMQMYKKKEYIYSYNGMPYTTLEIVLNNYIYNKTSYICINEYMLAINSVLVEMLKGYLTNKICIFEFLKEADLKGLKDLSIKVIGSENVYNLYKEKFKELDLNITYVPYNNVSVYVLDEGFEDIQKAVYNYAISNNIEIQIEDFENIDDVISNILNEKNTKLILILTKQDKSKITERLNASKKLLQKEFIYINEFPFNCVKLDLD